MVLQGANCLSTVILHLLLQTFQFALVGHLSLVDLHLQLVDQLLQLVNFPCSAGLFDSELFQLLQL